MSSIIETTVLRDVLTHGAAALPGVGCTDLEPLLLCHLFGFFLEQAQLLKFQKSNIRKKNEKRSLCSGYSECWWLVDAVSARFLC